jgi:hypothetical protein
LLTAAGAILTATFGPTFTLAATAAFAAITGSTACAFALALARASIAAPALTGDNGLLLRDPAVEHTKCRFELTIDLRGAFARGHWSCTTASATTRTITCVRTALRA